MPELLRPDLARLSPYDAHDPGDCDKLDANEVPYPLPDWFQEKLTFAVQHQQSHRYPTGNPAQLRALLGAYCGVPASWITIGNGSDELIRSLVTVSCVGTGRAVLSAEPTFSMYGILAQTLGVPFWPIPRNPETFTLDLPALKQTLAAHPVGAIFLPNPNSPTGTPLEAAELDFLRTLPTDLLVVMDEAYYEFSGLTVLSELPKRPHWVVLRTLSKAYRLAAFRVGYAVAQPDLITALEKVRLPYNISAFSQAAAQLALEHREQLLEVVPAILAERLLLEEGLGRLGVLLWPTAGNFLFFQIPGYDPAWVQHHLAQQGTLIRLTGGGLRVTVGNLEENQRFLARLAAVLDSKPGAKPFGQASSSGA
ncbi:histidinol-phosphate transaminase [Anthocerotibacter panamensis]|uniref:histidinol-phosphate transaminase n=1 Tax=Anthocerotibacter panamensis TaxID=2857077 RepID=UPI001C4072E8|nr:histidinol-phosphate transaminase [Anthocerotibacter panamensis]